MHRSLNSVTQALTGFIDHPDEALLFLSASTCEVKLVISRCFHGEERERILLVDVDASNLRDYAEDYLVYFIRPDIDIHSVAARLMRIMEHFGFSASDEVNILMEVIGDSWDYRYSVSEEVDLEIQWETVEDLVDDFKAVALEERLDLFGSDNGDFELSYPT